ncbi:MULTISPECIES: acetolactate synthase large subunit [Alteribacter]|uniref:Acetolactate synthase n=1 Tax=Alteribacter keqinensis TaxID=2483800 RepID=A0A3M7TRW6_9BACI|nr:acetolactate synthase large subunit [Alteribacter keqinensis]MBM7095441.1 acetolactate synthase large subunit [Alteribacter salitolerans]RNA67949.1 acetolactate synthase large subunit [Alteribacter keqinensis]
MNLDAKAGREAVVQTKTGADLLIQTLVEEKVDTIFGYPGGAVLPIYDAIYRAEDEFSHILTRHEQGAIHAAEGYARVSGKPGVVIATSGPGATNLITGIADAMMDSLPLVVFTGQVARTVVGTDAFQEADVMGITTPITKQNYQVQDVRDLPRIVKEAFHIASTGRPGPVVVDVPKDISANMCDDHYDASFYLPGYQPTIKPNPLQVKKLADALAQSKKPVILAGAGVIHGKASQELRAFAEHHSLPVTTTLLGLGCFPGKSPLSLGMAGMHGTYTANMALYECDLLINVGARFDDRLTGNLKHFAPNATVAHIDIDPAEIGKNVTTHIPIVSDAKEALAELNRQAAKHPNHTEWMEKLNNNKKSYPLWYNKPDQEMCPQWLMEKVHEMTNGEAIVTTDVGQHQMWAAQYYSFNEPNRWVTSGGLGTMGFGFPAAIGAQLAKPDRTVVAIVGDGGFQMTMQELSVLQERGLPVKVIIVNNEALGMVRQWQEAFYDKRYSESLLGCQPDFVKLAESYYLKAMKVDSQKELVQVLPEVFAYDGPVVLDARVLQAENVYPMIAPGKGLHEMIGVRP